MAIIIVLAAGLWYYRKLYAKTKQQLDYEMNDARNLGQISQSRDVPEGKMDNYSHLRAQSED